MSLTEAQARQKIAALPKGREPRINWAGFDLPGEAAQGNLLVVGGAGTGKTRIQRQLVRSLLQQFKPGSGRKVLVYDTKGDRPEELWGMSSSSPPLVLTGPDNLASAWDLAADMTSLAQVHRVAETLIEIEAGTPDPYFAHAAREMLSGLLLTLIRQRPGNFNLGTIIRIASSPDQLKSALADWPDKRFFPSASSFEHVQAVLAYRLRPLEEIAESWERAERKVSLKQWVSNGESPLILAEDVRLYARFKTINRFLLNQITSFILEEPDSASGSRFWFVFDDLHYTGRLDSLPSLLNARAKGVRWALSLSGFETPAEIYGEQTAVSAVADQFATVAFLKVSSVLTRRWASQRTGHDFQPDDFSELPQCGADNITAIHIIKGLQGSFKATTKVNP